MFVPVPLLMATIAFLIYWLWLRAFDYWKRKGFPYVPGRFPFGTLREMALMTKFQGHTTQELYNKLSPNPFGGVYIWNSPQLLLRDPEIIRAVMTKNFQHFTDRGRRPTSPSDPLSQHMLDLSGDLWRTVRAKVTPAFSSGRIKRMFTLIEACALQMDETLRKTSVSGKSVNLKEISMCYTLDVIMTCGFGLEMHAAENEVFRDISRKLFLPYVPLYRKIITSLYSIFTFLPKIYYFKLVSKEFADFFLNLIQSTVKHREENNIVRDDFLDLMMQLKNKGSLDDEKKGCGVGYNVNGSNVNFEITTGFMAAQCYIFYAAGFETSASTLTFALYELALHQDMQERLYQEIVDVIKQNGGNITYESLKEMTYTEQVISEVMRKYSPLPVLTRQCTNAFTIPDHPNLTIDEGTKIIIPVYALHHDPKFFPNPQNFDPERFSPENKSSITPYTYLPFGDGPRQCIGMRFGSIVTTMGLVTILRKYRILVIKDTPTTVHFTPSNTTLAISHPIEVLFKAR